MIATTKMTPKFCFYNDPEVSGPDSQLKKDHPNITNEELKTTLKQMWKDLPDDQRRRYEEMSQTAQTTIEPTQTTTRPTTNTQPPTQPLTKKVPKRAKNAYMQYITDKEVKRLALEEDSSLKGKTLNAQLAKQWRELSEEEKKPYVDLYEKEKAHLLQNPILLDKPIRSRSRQTQQTTQTKPKRAKPAYLYYSHDPEVKAKLQQEYTNLDNAGLRTKLGETWKTLTPEERQPYVDRYEQEKADLLKNPIMITKTINKPTPIHPQAIVSTPLTSPPQDQAKIQELETTVKKLLETVAELKKQVLEMKKEKAVDKE